VPDVEQFVRAGECQCCGALVPSAHRQSSCAVCGSPVIYRLHENGRSGRSRSGQTQEVASPMPRPQYLSAQDALDLAVMNRGERSVPAACPSCGDDLQGRMLLIRDQEAGESYDTIVEDTGLGDGPCVLACDACGRQLAPDIVVLRDRHGRCAAQIAELQAVA
jgi:predicted RNA-binding Zn-ribbon protein involved in translation (DUF1610 family)